MSDRDKDDNSGHIQGEDVNPIAHPTEPEHETSTDPDAEPAQKAGGPTPEQRRDDDDAEQEDEPASKSSETAPAGGSLEAMDIPSGITLLDGEEVIHDMHPSWGSYSKSLWAALLTIWMFGLGIVFLIYPFLARRNERYIVTTERVIHRSGLLGTTTNEYRIADVRGLQTGQSWTEKLFGSGNIKFSAAGGTITFSGVPDAQQVANTIRRRKAELE